MPINFITLYNENWKQYSVNDWINSNFPEIDSFSFLQNYYNIYYGVTPSISGWEVDYSNTHSLIISSEIDPLDIINEQISINGGVSETYQLNTFSNNNLVLNNTKTVIDSYGEEDIELDLESKLISIVIDQSGSSTWSDKENLRFDIAKRFVRKIINSYPGNTEFSIYKYGGERVSVQVSTTTVANNPFDITYNSNIIYDKDTFIDINSNFYGIRILRKEGSFSLTPIDGEIIFDGITDQLNNNGLTSGITYYYSIYTYDQNYNFSEPVTIKVTPQNNIIPQGVKTFTVDVLKEYGLKTTENTLALWHFNEGSGDIAYDYTGNNYDVTFAGGVSTEQEIFWRDYDSPSGTSSVRLQDLGTDGGFIGPSTQTIKYQAPFSVSFWYKQEVNNNQGVIICNSNGVVSDWFITCDGTKVGGTKTGIVFTIDNSGTIINSTSSLTINEWHHVAITVNSNGLNNIKIYLDGVLDKTDTGPIVSGFSTANFALEIGQKFNVSNFAGSIKDLAVYDIELDQTYISTISSFQTVEDDNGDRLAIINYTVPSFYDYIGGKVRVVKNDYSIPSNEEDGTVISDISVIPGEYYFTYKYNYVLNRNYNFRIFSQNSIGNYSHIYDSTNISINIPELSEESKNNLNNFIGNPNVDSPTNLSITSGNSKNYIKWDFDNSTGNSERILIYYSTDNYPIVDWNNITGTLIHDGNISIKEFVHRNIKNDTIYYYSVFAIDKYERVSLIQNVSGKPESNLSDDSIPRLKISGLSYEIVNENSINLFWDNIPEKRVIDAYFDEDVIIFAKILGISGNIINEDFKVTIEKTITTEKDSLSAEDIFDGQTTQPVLDENELVNFVLSDFSNGYSKGILRLRTVDINNNLILQNYKNIIINLNIKIYLPDINSGTDEEGNYLQNIFEYTSEPIEIRYTNPFNLDLINRDNRYVKIKCKNTINSSSNQNNINEKIYNGTYVGSSNKFIARIILKYKNLSLPFGSIISAALYSCSKELCDDSDPVILENANNLLSNSGNISVNNGNIEILDSNGNGTGVFENSTYIDLNIENPETHGNYILYIKSKFGNLSFVKKLLIVIGTTLKIDLVTTVPLSNGMTTSQQFANVYLLDPNDPENLNAITYPIDNTVVKWELTKTSTSYPTRNIYSSDSVPINGGIYSYITNGVADNVFIGPISTPITYGKDSENNTIYESHILKASVMYNGISVSDSQTIEILPLIDSGQISSSSNILMEFDNLKNDLYSDGKAYVKMVISHDPSTSVTKYSDCFRDYMTSVGKTIYTLQEGQLIYISTNDSETEIIWGTVVETVDSFNGQNILDTTNSNIEKGSAYISLSSGSSTTIYFRINKNISDQKSTGFIESTPLFSTLRENSYLNNKYEIIVSGATTTILNGQTISLTGGGNMENGIPSTIIVPKEPLQIKIVDRRVDGTSVENLVIDGQSINEILFEVSFSGLIVPNDTILNVEIINYYEDLIKTGQTLLYTNNVVEISLDPAVKSYVSLFLDPITKQKTFDSDLIISSTYDSTGDISRSKSICINFSHDEEDDISPINIFLKSIEKYNTTADTYANKSDLNYGRTLLSSSTVGTKIYAIGGANSNSIVSYNEEYDSSGDTWTVKTGMAYSRMGHLSVVVGTDIYIIGGISYNKNSNKLYVSNKIEKYDTTIDTWTTLTNMPEDVSTVDPIAYGNALGSAVYVSGQNRIYVFSGCRAISDDGSSFLYNDKIIYYDIIGDSWTILDVPTTVYRYNRISCFGTLDSANTRIGISFGVFLDENQKIHYLEDIYYYNYNTGLFEDNFTVNSGIIPRYNYAGTNIGTKSYILGGISTVSAFTKYNETFDVGATLTDTTVLSNITYGRNGASSCYINEGGTNYIYLIGGQSSGKNKEFLKIFATINPGTLLLNGKQHIEIKIELKDYTGNYPIANIDLISKGYLQIPNITENQFVQNDLIKYNVYFQSKTVSIINGKGIFTLEPRGDDIIDKIFQTNYFSKNTENLKYGIVLQFIIDDSNYYGKNYIKFVDSVQNLNSKTTENCIDYNNNFIIGSLTSESVSEYQLVSNPYKQNKPFLVQCVSDILWVNNSELVLDFSSDYLTIETSINSIESQSPIGSSPLYDTLSLVSKDLSTTDYDIYKKNILILTDGDSNSSTTTLEESINEIISIGGYENTKVIGGHLNVTNLSNDTVMIGKSIHTELNKLCEATGGQSATIVNSNFTDDFLGILVGEAKGSLGYGSATFILDMTRNINLENCIVNFNLPNNTNGSWKICISNDGYNFFDCGDKYPANYTATFYQVSGRYIKFEIELISGLTTGTDDAYDTIPLPYGPSVLSATINYIPQKIDYLYLNTEEVGSYVSQVSVDVETENPNTNINMIQTSASASESTDWSNYDNGSVKSNVFSGKTVIPVRSGTYDSVTMEKLINVDGFLYKTTSGSFNQYDTIIVYDSENNIISSSKYILSHKNGYVIFKAKQYEDFTVSIIPQEKFRVGIRVINNTTDSINIKGFGYFYNKIGSVI